MFLQLSLSFGNRVMKLALECAREHQFEELTGELEPYLVLCLFFSVDPEEAKLAKRRSVVVLNLVLSFVLFLNLFQNQSCLLLFSSIFCKVIPCL